ncbi:MAG: NAD-dependent epimerase/dehydratase family protein, partial [Aquabacterium sp.]|nr:NAD-dependent epimerase/dehydratase family protein [Ferruginibacter sp.]
MNILVTGANGYIGQRLIPVLLDAGHRLYCCVRNKSRFAAEHLNENISIIEIDFLEDCSKKKFPVQIDTAYFLIHSMSSSGDFESKEMASAENFIQLIEKTNCKQIIYLS